MSKELTEQEKQINSMYKAQLKSTKQTLKQNYKKNVQSINEAKTKSRKETRANLNQTAADSRLQQKNFTTQQKAAGLTTGAMAQAQLSQNNQLQANLGAIRLAQKETEQGLAQQRRSLAQEYSSAIAKAQADNDFERAKALYEEAGRQETTIRENERTAAQAMAQAGDFSIYGQVYGLTPEQVQVLQGNYDRQKQEEQDEKTRNDQLAQAQIMAQAGDFSLYKTLYPDLTDEQIQLLVDNYNKPETQQQEQEERQRLQESAQLLAQAGDFSLYRQLYPNLTDAQIQLLVDAYGKDETQEQEQQSRADAEARAQLLAQGGDFSGYKELYGLTDEQVANLERVWQQQNGGSTGGSTGEEEEDNGGNPPNATQVVLLQAVMGVPQTGEWDEATRQAAKKKYGTDDFASALQQYQTPPQQPPTWAITLRSQYPDRIIPTAEEWYQLADVYGAEELTKQGFWLKL